MELTAIERFICGSIASSMPEDEGLYLYMMVPSEPDFEDYPHVCVVEVQWYKNTLMADSDSFFTYMPVEMVGREIPGLWSVKLTLDEVTK